MPGQMVGNMEVIDTDSEPFEQTYRTLGATEIPGYSTLLFALVNWPTRGRSGDDAKSPA